MLKPPNSFSFSLIFLFLGSLANRPNNRAPMQALLDRCRRPSRLTALVEDLAGTAGMSDVDVDVVLELAYVCV